MAKLESEKLSLEIKNIVQYDSGNYEQFEISLKIKDENVFSDKILKPSYTLANTNIKNLIDEINTVLNGTEREIKLEFLEPNFIFEIKRFIDLEKDDLSKYIAPYLFKENLYEFIIWVTSGNWNGVYDDTSVGGRFIVYESKLKKFVEDLQEDYQNRREEPFLKH